MNFKRFKTQSIILYFDAQPYGLRYGWAMLTVAIAAIATLYVPVIGERAAFLLFFFAIIQTSFWLGRNPGIFAMFLSLIAVNALILFPASILKSYDVLILNAGFCVLSAVIVATTSLHRRLTGALWESRQRYAGIVESALDALITIDADQHILLFNAAAEKMFGCTADEAVGGSLERFIPKRFRPAHAAHIRAFGSTGASNRKMGELAAVKGLRADGEEFPIEAAISLCEINGEKSFTAILRDVTERVRADSALKEQLKLQDQLTKVAATVPGVICSFRLRPDGSACMPYASPVFESVYGLKPDAVAKDFSPIFARVHPRDIGHIHETIAESARTMQPWQDCFRYDHPTKGEIWIEGHSIPLREADGSTLWHGYIQDMTWEKKTELERQKFISLADNSQEFIGMCDMNLLPIDIEERKQAEQQITFLNRHLQRRIEEMQAIFDTAPIGLSIADDTTGCRIRGNPAIERMLGLAPGSELSLEGDTPAPICAMLNGRELAVEELPIQRANRGEVVTNQIIDISRPDGLVITVLSNASPLFNEEGFPRGAVGAFLDITELKRVEDSLTKSQTQLRTFIEQAPLSIAMFDREMNYLVTSRRWIEEFGRGYDDLTGRNHYWVNPDISAEWREIHVKAQAGAFLKNDDDLWIQADGSRHWLRWAAYPWTNQEGKIGGIIISCEDITARRTAEEELRTVQTRLAIVVEAVKAGYWDWDLNTSSVYLSPEWKRQIGFDENELLNRWEEWECRLHPDDRASVLAAAENYISGLLPVFELEFRLRHKDGLYRWVHSRGGLLRDPNNRPYRMLGINLDITDYKKQKELSERRDKMEQSFRLYVVTQTAAAIAHELHQPLAAISSYAEVALHMLQAGNQNPEKLGSLMEICAQQAQRAGGVIRQLMTVLHKDEALSESIDINQLAREALELVKAAGHLGAFSIELNLAAALPPVWANSLQIEKVLINLLRNGLESMQESGLSAGTITLTTRSTDDTPAMAQVTVRDGGKSVTDIAILKNMFQPFYTTKPQGLGMGLAISRALIEAHGGRMWAEQNAGNGISVHFTLSFVT